MKRVQIPDELKRESENVYPYKEKIQQRGLGKEIPS
jgi:hypothetical protein